MNTLQYQVNPSNRVDFSKIRKAQKGVKITKFQTPASTLEQSGWQNLTYDQWLQMQNAQKLKGWNPNLNKQTTVNNGQLNLDTHSHANNLDLAYQGIQNYTSNPNNVGSDMQYFANQNTFNDAQSFMDQYNQNIDAINNSWELGPAGKYNDKGWTNHNRLFQSMYNSRSIKGGDIGYDTRQEDILGSSTWLRRADQYEKRIADLTPEELKARTHNIKLANGQVVQFVKESDGTIIPLSEVNRMKQTQKQIDTTPQKPNTPVNPNNSPNSNTTPDPNQPGNSNNPNDVNGGRTPFFTSPIYNGMSLGLGLQGAANQYAAGMQNSVNLQEGPQANAQIVDNYTTNKNQAQTMEEQRFKAMQGLGSDLTQNLEHKAAVDQNVAENMQKLQASNEADLNNQRQQAKNIANANNQEGVQTANTNRDRLTADRNYRADLRSKLAAQKTELKIANLQANVTDWNNFKKDQAQNADLKQQAQNELEFNKGMAAAQQAYETKYGEGKNWFDDDQAVKDFWVKNYKSAKFVSKDDKTQLDLIGGAYNNPNNWNTESVNAARELIKKYNGNEAYSDTFKSYNENFETQRKAEQEKLRNSINANYYRLQGLAANGEQIIGNQYLGRPGRASIGRFAYDPNQTSVYKSGGRLDAYIKAHRDAQKETNKNFNISIKQINANLKRELDSLDREKMLLLKEMFK